jgi:hypothetical protein
MKTVLMKRYLCVIGMLVAACSDPAGPPAAPDPCTTVFACRSPGVDVEVVSVAVASNATDPVTMLPIVQPGALRVDFTIRNRGRIAAPLETMLLTLRAADNNFLSQVVRPQPPLAPGESYSGSTLIEVGSLEGNRLRDDRMMVEVWVGATGDTLNENNVMSSALFHLAVPLPDLSFTTEPFVTVGQSVGLSVIVRNYGRHADLPAQTVTGCLYDGFRGCTPDYRTSTGSFATPAVAAGSAVQFNTTMMIPPSAAWQDAAARYNIYLCTGLPSTYDVANSIACGFSTWTGLTVRPDYESVCAPPLLVAGITVTLSTYNCGLRPSLAGFEAETRAYRFHIASLQAESNVTYALQRSDTTSVVRIYDAQGNSVRDIDPAPEYIRVDVAQRIYLVMYSSTESLAIAAAIRAHGAP